MAAPSGLLLRFAALVARVLGTQPQMAAPSGLLLRGAGNSPRALRPLDSRDWGVRRARGSDHPPGPLPKRKGERKRKSGRHPPDPCQMAAPSGLLLRGAGNSPRARSKGCVLWTRAIGGFAALVARTIPPAPFLRGRGKEKKSSLWRHILHISCQRSYTPLDSPLASAGGQP